VNAALKESWQPNGAPFIHVRAAAVACCQAMVNFHQPTSAENNRQTSPRGCKRFPPIKLEEGHFGDISAAMLAGSDFANMHYADRSFFCFQVRSHSSALRFPASISLQRLA